MKSFNELIKIFGLDHRFRTMLDQLDYPQEKTLVKLLILDKVAIMGLYIDPKITEKYTEKAVTLAENRNIDFFSTHFIISRAQIMIRQGEINNAKRLFNKAEKKLKKVRSDYLMANYYSFISDYFDESDPPKSIYCSKKAIELFKKINYKKGVFRSRFNLFASYLKQRNLEQAERLAEILLRSPIIKTDQINRAKLFNNLAIISYHKKDLAGAKKYFQRSLDLAEKFRLTQMEYRLLYNLATINYYQGNREKSIEQYHLLWDNYRNYCEFQTKLLWLNALATSYYEMNKFKTSLRYFKIYLDLTENTKSHEKIILCYLNIAGIYWKLGEIKSAIELKKRFTNYIKKNKLKEFKSAEILIDIIIKLLKSSDPVSVVKDHRDKIPQASPFKDNLEKFLDQATEFYLKQKK